MIELFLEKLGGKQYCENISQNPLRSFHLAIYSAVKAQLGVIKIKDTNFKYSLILVEQIDKIINEKIPLKNHITLRSPEEINFSK
jgi:hypothetical protein